MKPYTLLAISLAFTTVFSHPAVSGDAVVSPPSSIELPVEGRMPSLTGAKTWIGSPALSPAALRGKVVLVDFWTYSCINSLRQIPYLRAWAERYGNRGLVVIGVHSPEFGFEKDLDNVRTAVKDIAPGYPVAVDSEHAVWRAFDNEYWPALYIVDSQGRIRHHVFGEGEYERTEAIIRQLLAEAGHADLPAGPAKVISEGVEAQADWAQLRSGETYVGYGRADGFASPGGMRHGRSETYARPNGLSPGSWGLVGDWTVNAESAQADKAGARIVYRIHARDVHLVMGPSASGAPVRFRVLVNGKPPGAGHGVDVGGDGSGTVTKPRMYQLIRQAGGITDRDVEIEFLDPGIQVYSFTFG
ncbi:thiol-disulfide isomerase/thioredoxin [Luteibacter jiangsuensis]|uniref:Thiol-disulfide isomerase/thioredoxin n=1 Tax=Luteibacter jiangsuensis TaxID=637577 RepID=A0ABT9SUT9_9GAMM|nr:redoxin domain-containing protein [Luteibacter jiangsuensis]MDQ0008151.1 thiol-disulfide isomerase/thioredoxin [Luteibacter jiangsuensis]